jgi:hypothetical protein
LFDFVLLDILVLDSLISDIRPGPRIHNNDYNHWMIATEFNELGLSVDSRCLERGILTPRTDIVETESKVAISDSITGEKMKRYYVRAVSKTEH